MIEHQMRPIRNLNIQSYLDKYHMILKENVMRSYEWSVVFENHYVRIQIVNDYGQIWPTFTVLDPVKYRRYELKNLVEKDLGVMVPEEFLNTTGGGRSMGEIITYYFEILDRLMPEVFAGEYPILERDNVKDAPSRSM